MKLLFTEGVGASQTTTNAQDEKIPVYETKTAAETDLVNLEVGQIIATKDEGNELSNPVDVVQDGNMHAVTSNAVADGLSYSTDEVKTGGKWIDGKPIYRKTIDCGSLPNTSYKNVNHNITNLDYVIKCYGFARGGNYRMVLPNASANTANAVEVYVDNDYIVIQTGNDRSGYNGYITIEYTKATD